MLLDVHCNSLIDFFFCFTGENNELDAVSAFSEIVPDTVVFDDFER